MTYQATSDNEETGSESRLVDVTGIPLGALNLTDQALGQSLRTILEGLGPSTLPPSKNIHTLPAQKGECGLTPSQRCLVMLSVPPGPVMGRAVLRFGITQKSNCGEDRRSPKI